MTHAIRVDHDRLKHAARVVNDAVQRGGYASAVLAVANRTEVVWQQVVGGSDPVQWNSIFSIASISKPVTITALMQLVERGYVVLRDPVADYLPQFAQQGKERVTLWHLVTHTSGVNQPDAEEDEALERQRAPLTAYLEVAYQRGLRFAPGTQWAYTQITYSILGEVMTQLSGQPYPEFMREHLFAPLGMVDTAFIPTDASRLVRQFGDERTPEERAYRDSLAFPAFGLYSTAADLIAFGQAMLNMGKRGAVRVLSEGAVATMTRVHTHGIPAIEDGTPQPTYQGLGWGMRSPFGNVIGSEHGYGHAGYGGSWLWIDPAWDLVFVLLSNSQAAQPNIPIRALNAVYGALERQ